MPDTLYDIDRVRWSDEQAALLRRLAVAGASNAVDWDNVIEEVECVGRSQRHAVDSLLRRALVHMLKIIGDPAALSVERWFREVEEFLAQARSRSTGALRAKLDLDRVWRESVHLAGHELTEYGRSIPSELPDSCPFSIGELLADDVDVRALCGRLIEGGRRSR